MFTVQAICTFEVSGCLSLEQSFKGYKGHALKDMFPCYAISFCFEKSRKSLRTINPLRVLTAHADYSSFADLRPPVKLTTEEMMRRRGRVCRWGWRWTMATTMPRRLPTTMPASRRRREVSGEEVVGEREPCGVHECPHPTGRRGGRGVQGAPRHHPCKAHQGNKDHGIKATRDQGPKNQGNKGPRDQGNKPTRTKATRQHGTKDQEVKAARTKTPRHDRCKVHQGRELFS